MPSSRIFTFTDPHQYQAAIRAAHGVQVCPTAKGDFRSELIQIDLNRLWMQRARESLPRIIFAAVKKDRAAIEFPIGEPGFRHHGIDVSSGEIVVDGVDSAHRLSLGPCHWGAMSL